MEDWYKPAIISGIVLFVLLGCAKQNTAGPSGGPKDVTPPVIISSDPPMGSGNFSGKSFEVTFDEYFVLDNVTQKLLVSPPLEAMPEIKTKGKSMLVSFDEELKENVTYTFYFQDALRDLNEGNVYENFQYFFSTGPDIDSLSVTGSIFDAFDLEPVEDVYVMLYSQLDDTIPLTTGPRYLTRANNKGKFRIDHIAGGTYAMYGLVDLNSNKMYDLPEETFAFLDSTITITPSGNFIAPMPDTLKSAADSAAHTIIPGKEYELYLFTREKDIQYITSSQRNQANMLMITFSMPVDSGQFDISFPGYDNATFINRPSAERDTFRIWLTDSLMYNLERLSARLKFPETDSTGAITISYDTIEFRYIAPKLPRGQVTQPDNKLKYSTNVKARVGLKPEQMVTFRFETPVYEPDTSLINLYMVNDTVLLPLDYNISGDSLNSDRYTLSHQFVPDSTYLLITDRGAFRDIFGKVNDSTGIKFPVTSGDNFGSLILTLSGFKGNVILQLLRPDEKIVTSRYLNLPDDSKVEFKYLDKGLYKLKMIIDIDGNGEWTTGDYTLKREPEPVTYYPDDIDIKASWMLEENWVIKSIREKNRNKKAK